MRMRTKRTVRQLLSLLAIVTILCQIPVGAIVAPEDSMSATDNFLSLLEEYPEDVSLRTKNEKHFRYGDGGYLAAVYNAPVHYLDSNNEWKDIDNTLKLVTQQANSATATSSANSYYENTANSFKVRLPKTLSSTANIQIEYDDYNLGFRMINSGTLSLATVNGTDKTQGQKLELLQKMQTATDASQKDQLMQQAVSLLPNQTSGLSYTNVRQNTNLVYQIDGQKLKESIILTAPTTQQTFSFAFTYTGLSPVVQEFGAVHFYAVDRSDDEPIFIIEAPYMEDANTQEDTLCMDIDVSVTPTATGCIYTMTPDSEWLNDPSRVYPITIDPTTTTSTASADIQDNGVNESDPDQNYKIFNRMYVGSNVSGGKGYESRVYIRFPRVSAIKTNTYVASALLCLDHYPVSSWQTADQNKFDVYEVPSSYNWDSDLLDWNEQKDYVFTNRITTYISDADTSSDFGDITSLVRKWYATTDSNNGLVIKPREVFKDKTNRTCYYSSDCDASYASKRPRIHLIYYPRKALNVPLYGQELSKWCWAASAQMVGEYYGEIKSQLDIVCYTKNLSSNSSSAVLNKSADATDTLKATKYAAASSSFTYTTTINEEMLFDKINAGHPVILLRTRFANSDNSPKGGHITVVYGYTSYNGSRYYLINDPWPADSDPWPESNPGQSLKWKYSKIANQAISDNYTYKLVGIISK